MWLLKLLKKNNHAFVKYNFASRVMHAAVEEESCISWSFYKIITVLKMIVLSTTFVPIGIDSVAYIVQSVANNYRKVLPT